MKTIKSIEDIREEAKNYLLDLSIDEFTLFAIEILKLDIKQYDYDYHIGNYLTLSSKQYELNYMPLVINNLNGFGAIKVFKQKIGPTIYFNIISGNPDYCEYELKDAKNQNILNSALIK